MISRLGKETMQDFNDRNLYEFDLPDTLIATQACQPRDSSKLMLVKPEGCEHRVFRDIIDELRPNDLLVLNNVAVVAARFFAKRSTGGRVEILITGDINQKHPLYECMHKSRHYIKSGESLTTETENPIVFQFVRKNTDDGEKCYVAFSSVEELAHLLESAGQLPLPPYIVKRRKALEEATYSSDDAQRYQTVFASNAAAIAAPTAGLHFTHELLEAIRRKGVNVAFLQLNVGAGTFQPIRAQKLSEHRMHYEKYVIDEALAKSIRLCKEQRGRVIAVGTTVVRSLEDQALRYDSPKPGVYDTDIFIKPGHTFQFVDAMITNFHLPGSTLMVLVSAFSGYTTIKNAYSLAIEKHYRFYSYGDAMLLYPKRGEQV